jgi:hypothetical protein
MGFTPEQVDRMSIWEYTACVAAFERDDTPEFPTADEFYDAIASTKVH